VTCEHTHHPIQRQCVGHISDTGSVGGSFLRKQKIQDKVNKIFLKGARDEILRYWVESRLMVKPQIL
jgi:hypothetical protein